MEGWVKLYRKILEWEWFSDPKTLQVFIFILLSANHEDAKWQGKIVKRGQFVTSVAKISEITQLSTKSVRTILNRLKSANQLAIKTANRYSLITVTNYELYQCQEIEKGKQNGKQTGNPRANKGQTKGNKQEGKELKNEKKENIALQIIFPWTTETFKEAWQLWRDYKREQHKFSYKPIGEQAALKDLAELSEGNEATAIELIYYAMSKGWKGIYKNNTYEKEKQRTGATGQELAVLLSKKLGFIQ